MTDEGGNRSAMILTLTETERQIALAISVAVGLCGLVLAAAGNQDTMEIHGWLILAIAAICAIIVIRAHHGRHHRQHGLGGGGDVRGGLGRRAAGIP